MEQLPLHLIVGVSFLRFLNSAAGRALLDRLQELRSQEPWFEDYAEFLRGELWQILRLLALERAGYCCNRIGCLEEDQTRLRVHHVRYRRNWWETTLEDLEVICARHHEIEHGGIDVSRLLPRSRRRRAAGWRDQAILRKIDKGDGVVSPEVIKEIGLELTWPARTHRKKAG